MGDNRVTEGLRSTGDVCGETRSATPEEIAWILPRQKQRGVPTEWAGACE